MTKKIAKDTTTPEIILIPFHGQEIISVKKEKF